MLIENLFHVILKLKRLMRIKFSLSSFMIFIFWFIVWHNFLFPKFLLELIIVIWHNINLPNSSFHKIWLFYDRPFSLLIRFYRITIFDMISLHVYLAKLNFFRNFHLNLRKWQFFRKSYRRTTKLKILITAY